MVKKSVDFAYQCRFFNEAGEREGFCERRGTTDLQLLRERCLVVRLQ